MLKAIGAKFNKASRIMFNRLNNHRTTDAYLIGYPKCGNTWLQFMLGIYLQILNGNDENQTQPLFNSFDRWGVCVRLHPSVPRFQFTHDGLEWITQTAEDLSAQNLVYPYRRKKVALLVRNIPDMLVSFYWHQKTRVLPSRLYKGEISEFIRDPVFGVDKAVVFYKIWDESQPLVPELILLRYEDLKQDPEGQFRRFLKFWNIPIHDEYITRAVHYARFDNMKNIENANRGNSALIHPGSGLPIFKVATSGESTGEASHVRKGQVGGYREYFSQMDIDFLRDKMRSRIPAWYGYPDGLFDE
jgi:hypothetical protein